ncbi:endonuclease/exonuclease/phosphatase family protein, partial [Trifolium pratense]
MDNPLPLVPWKFLSMASPPPSPPKTGIKSFAQALVAASDDIPITRAMLLMSVRRHKPEIVTRYVAKAVQKNTNNDVEHADSRDNIVSAPVQNVHSNNMKQLRVQQIDIIKQKNTNNEEVEHADSREKTVSVPVQNENSNIVKLVEAQQYNNNNNSTAEQEDNSDNIVPAPVQNVNSNNTKQLQVQNEHCNIAKPVEAHQRKISTHTVDNSLQYNNNDSIAEQEDRSDNIVSAPVQNVNSNNRKQLCVQQIGAHEKWGRRPPPRVSCDDFLAWSNAHSHTHLQTTGAQLTWNNGRLGSEYVALRLDKTI